MELLILPILLSLCVQSGLNWNLLLLRRRTPVSQSFLGVFSVSLAVVDATVTLCVGALHFAGGPLTVLGLRFTRFHICLLVQILGQLYSSLQGPVLCLAALDHVCTVAHRSCPAAATARPALYSLSTAVLWLAAIFFVFLLSDFAPLLEDVPHSQIRQCWVFHASQVLPVAMLALALGCAAVHVGYCAGLLKEPPGAAGAACSLRGATEALLSTWAPLLLLAAVLLLLHVGVGVPAHLGLNAAWICLLNSLLTAALLCVVPPADLAALPPDSFYERRRQLGPAAAAPDSCC